MSKQEMNKINSDKKEGYEKTMHSEELESCGIGQGRKTSEENTSE